MTPMHLYLIRTDEQETGIAFDCDALQFCVENTVKVAVGLDGWLPFAISILAMYELLCSRSTYVELPVSIAAGLGRLALPS